MVWFGLVVVVLFVGVSLACRFSSAHDTTTACIQSLLSLIGIGVHRRRPAKDQRGVAKAGGECVYADYAGNAQVDTGLLDACFHELRTHSHEYRNPHSVDDGLEHTDATSVRAIDELRKKTLAYCKAQDDEYACIITHGATSACKIVADCFPWSHRNCFWYLMDNHTSVVGMKGCAEAKGASTRAVFAEEVLHAVEERGSSDVGMGLFAMPLESNFSGRRYSMDLVHSIQYGKKYGNGDQRMRVLLDAAKACASYPPDLSGDVKPDFVVLSYYKIFGYPTGLGALIARRDALREFLPTYVGGGTVDFFVAREGVCDRKKGEEAFEDGTLSYYSIPCACIGFDWFAKNVGSASEIDASSVLVAKRCAERLIGLRHANGRPICRVYGAWEDVMNTSIEDCCTRQGPTVSFNVFDQFGDAYGCRQVNRMASVCGISLRAGALCNSGGLIEALGIPSSEMMRWRNLGYTCDGQVDSIDGVTTGVVRASFGYQSVPADADRIAAFVQKYFMDTTSISVDFAGKKESSELVSRVHVEAMYIYPIKSCQPQQVCSWPLGHDGLQYDRFWKIVDANDRTISLKTCPLLCKVKPVVSTKEETLQIFFDKEDDCVTVPLHGGNAQYSEVNAWLSSKLGISCTLVDQRSNESGKNYSKQGDCLVLSKSSIKYLHSKSGCSEDLETFTQRLRPNLVLSGSHNNQGGAFEDDKWQMIAARDGDIVGRKTKQCTRCGVICMDPHTGKQSKNMEPLRSIMSAKQEYPRKEKCSFGSLFSFNGTKGVVMQCGMEFNTVY